MPNLVPSYRGIFELGHAEMDEIYSFVIIKPSILACEGCMCVCVCVV